MDLYRINRMCNNVVGRALMLKISYENFESAGLGSQCFKCVYVCET